LFAFRAAVRGVWVQDDRRHGCAAGFREFRDKGESVGAGREIGSIGHHELVRWYSILVRVKSCREGAVHPVSRCLRCQIQPFPLALELFV